MAIDTKFTNILNRARNLAHKKGHGATRVFRIRTHGTREQISSTASVALAAEPVIGKALHSVFDGPKRRSMRGAPALKRQRSA